MHPPFISGKAAEAPASPVELPTHDRERETAPHGYILDGDLLAAVNVALLLGNPLLLTGEPGTGKTQLAHRIAWELGYGKALVFNTKSTSTARDLLYSFDTLGRFHASHVPGASQSNLDYLSFSALGMAILRSLPPAAVAAWLGAGVSGGDRRRTPAVARADERRRSGVRSVVLVDEIDKAGRDFPNDLLHEVDRMAFRVPELRSADIAAAPDRRPVLVITSNSEHNLPDAFLRRCVYYHIDFLDRAPAGDADRVAAIVAARVDLRECPASLLANALVFFREVRARGGLMKKPSTAELIDWVRVLARPVDGVYPDPVRSEAGRVAAKLTLAKTTDDRKRLEELAEEWSRK